MPSPADDAGRATRPLADCRLYLCTPDRTDLESFVAACIDGGVDVVQLRDKHLVDRDLLRRAAGVAEVCARDGVTFLINDRTDLAAALRCGVHVGQDDLAPAHARSILGPDAVIGLSTHAPAELDASTGSPVDYISVGPVEPTPTKPGRPGTGLGYVRYAAARCDRPWFVTGGVQPDRIPELVAAGARRFVVVRWLTEARDPGAAARMLREAIDAAIDQLA